MLTELIIGGLLLVSSPAQSVEPGALPAPASLHSESRQGGAACVEGNRPPGRSALLEAHAAFSALAPFSLARTPSPASPTAAPMQGSAPECKS